MSACRFLRRLTFLFCACLVPAAALGQDGKTIAQTPADAPRCSVVTVAPGDDLASLFGHTAIRIRDPRLATVFRGETDVWFDYGVFNPSDWTFWLHYAKGDADYLLVAAPSADRLDWYRQSGREIAEQELHLTREEAGRLEDALVENLRHPEYAYRFLDDNCTTRAAKMLEKAQGKPLAFAASGTCRDFSDVCMSGNPWVQIGANLLMGRHADHPCRLFLPVHLQHALAPAAGSPPLHFIPAGANAKGEPAPAGRLTIIDGRLSVGGFQRRIDVLYGGIIGAVCAFFAALTVLRWRKGRPLPQHGWLDALLFGAVGAIGCLMAFLGVWSLHPELGSFNWNLIWCWPFHLLLALGLLCHPGSRMLRLYARIAALGAVLATLAYFLVPQSLPVPLFPIVPLLAVRATRWGWPPREMTDRT